MAHLKYIMFDDDNFLLFPLSSDHRVVGKTDWENCNAA